MSGSGSWYYWYLMDGDDSIAAGPRAYSDLDDCLRAIQVVRSKSRGFRFAKTVSPDVPLKETPKK